GLYYNPLTGLIFGTIASDDASATAYSVTVTAYSVIVPASPSSGLAVRLRRGESLRWDGGRRAGGGLIPLTSCPTCPGVRHDGVEVNHADRRLLRDPVRARVLLVGGGVSRGNRKGPAFRRGR